jgi:chromosome segregation ATPase
MSNMEQAVKDLQDALIVISEIERRQSALLLEHSERIVNIEQHLERVARLEAESAEFRRRTDQNLAEITDKLNGLIGYVGGMHPPPQ